MAVVKMRKLHLLAMSYDKDAVLNALQQTGAAEITQDEATEWTDAVECDGDGLRTQVQAFDDALELLRSVKATQEKGKKSSKTKETDTIRATYAEFLAVCERRDEAEQTLVKLAEIAETRARLKAEAAAIERQKLAAEPYKTLRVPFSRFSRTKTCRCYLGTIGLNDAESLRKEIENRELCAAEVLAKGENSALVLLVEHREIDEDVSGLLTSYGFNQCPYEGEETGESLMQSLEAQTERIAQAVEENERGVYALTEKIPLLKLYRDYLSFCFEKNEASKKMRATQTTISLRAYVPITEEERVSVALNGVSNALFYEFSDPTEDDEPPTLLNNSEVTACFEGITNTYSAPNYREFDPNAIMAFFYSLFMGFIIGDAGYGLIMSLVGGYIWYRGRREPTGTSRLCGAFAIGGLFAIFWGALFNSAFGFAFLPKTVMPDAQSDMWTLVGISVPSVLLIAMLVGIAQLFAGYLCKAVQEWRRGNLWDGVFDGVVWAIFSVGVALAIVGLIEEAKLPFFASVGGVTAGVSLLVAVLTAGRKEKALGKFTKGFGAAYGVINYASDILSYARLYGLMLSGAVIAQIVADYSAQFIASGNVLLIVLAVVLLIVGNAFNLVMNLLGAYIHDARLQYVEFYGRFFEGEGELFKPLGSERKYTRLRAANGEGQG